MSRIARKPLTIPKGVQFNLTHTEVHISGAKGSFNYPLHPAVVIEVKEQEIWIRSKDKPHPMVGTTCKILGNMVKGVHEGFERKLQLVGVGYRAKTQGKVLELSLGYSNPVLFEIPEGITIDTPSNTEIIVKGIDKQRVGQTASNIRIVRPPEPYKGKGVRYSDEKITLKETKKK